MDCSPPVSSIHGIFQARILEWVAMPFSRASSQPRDQTCISCIGRQILYHCVTWVIQGFFTSLLIFQQAGNKMLFFFLLSRRWHYSTTFWFILLVLNREDVHVPGKFHRHSSLMGYSPCMGSKIVGLNTHTHMHKKPSVKKRMVMELGWGRYTISTWHFECAHGPVGESSTKGMPAERGQGGRGHVSVEFWDKQQEIHTFSCPWLPSSVSILPVTEVSLQDSGCCWGLQLRPHHQLDVHSPFSLSTCSARETDATGCHLHHNSLGVAFSRVQSTHVQMHRWVHL